MAEYTVKVGQNLFDVALYLYGSIEGILDLFSCNLNLSMDTDIKAGDILKYTDSYNEDSTVLDYFKSNNIVPANQLGNIYYKSQPLTKMLLYVDSKLIDFAFTISGSGNIYIDWGDNSLIENFKLTSIPQEIKHIANNELYNDRKIRVFGDFNIYSIDFTNIPPHKLYITSPLCIESLTILGANHLENIEFLNLTDPNVFINIDLVHTRISDLLPLVNLNQARSINLSYSNISQSVLDRYLIALVKEYGIRRNCTVNLIGSIDPSGKYQKPKDLRNPSSGMEAIWVIVNEHKESSGPWKFILTNNTYTQ